VKVTRQLLSEPILPLTGVRVQGFGVVNVTVPGPVILKVTVPVGNVGVGEVSIATALQVTGWPATNGEAEVHDTVRVVISC
jgi:hypothetical protein